MPAYLFQLELPQGDLVEKEVLAAQKEHINQLFLDGKIRSYSVAINNATIWCVMEAEEEQGAMDLVLRFPIYPLCTDVTNHALQIHHTQPYILPDISLN